MGNITLSVVIVFRDGDRWKEKINVKKKRGKKNHTSSTPGYSYTPYLYTIDLPPPSLVSIVAVNYYLFFFPPVSLRMKNITVCIFFLEQYRGLKHCGTEVRTSYLLVDAHVVCTRTTVKKSRIRKKGSSSRVGHKKCSRIKLFILVVRHVCDRKSK